MAATTATIEQLLGLPALMGLVEETTSGLPQEKFLPKEFTTTTREVIGNSAQATLVQGQRKVSRAIQYNGAPVGAVLETIGTDNWVLLHSSEELDIDPVTFQRLRNYESWTEQRLGAEEIGRQVGLFVKKFENWQSTITLMMVMAGIAYFDQYGNLLPTSAGAAWFETMLIPAGNQTQLNWNGNGNLITASWAYNTTNIPLQLRTIIKAALQLTGYEPEWILYGENVPGYIQTNSYMQQYLARNPMMNATLMDTGEIPDGLLGFKWIPAWKAFYTDSTNTNQPIVNPDAVTLVPKPMKYWYELVLGSMQLPKTLDIVTNVEAAMSNIELRYGKYIYAQLQQKPIRLTTVGGHTMLPTIKVPNAVWQAIVAF